MALLFLQLLVLVSAVAGAPVTIDIPKATWAPIFFESIDAASSKAHWESLRNADVKKGDIEVRVWFGFGREPLEGFRLQRDADHWTGTYVRQALENGWPVETRPVTPQSNWPSLWQSLVSAGILTLPDSSTLPGEKRIMDGRACVVEINDGQHYRTYAYHSPAIQSWPEARKMIQIGDILSAELYQSVLDDRYKAERATWPKTRKEAVDRVLSEMSEKDQETLRNTSKDELVRYHFGLGLGIRNDFGMWKGNNALLKDCGASIPDDASMMIIRDAWRRLQPPSPVRVWRLVNASWISRAATALVALLALVVARGIWRRVKPKARQTAG